MARGSSVDEHAVTELTLFIENDYDLTGAPNSQGVSIMKNLARKIIKGKYDSALAVKLWAYLADSGARKYGFQYNSRMPGVRSWHSYPVDGGGVFSKATRMEVARGLAQAFEASVKAGEVDLKALAAR